MAMDWKAAQVTDGMVKVPGSWLHLYYYEALNILFRFENALRLFVYVVLKDSLGKDWDSASIGGAGTIRSETKKRIAQANDHGYVGEVVTSPMLFLSSGDLTTIMLHESYWKHFAPYFRAKQGVIQTKLAEINTVRNSLAHFRPIRQDDVELIKQTTKHVLLEVQACLGRISGIRNVVPTNSDREWYKQIKPIGNPHFATNIFSSPDEKWIRIRVTQRCTVLRNHMYSDRDYLTSRVTTLRTAQVVKHFEKIRDACIFISDGHTSSEVRGDAPIVQRSINIVFSEPTLTAKVIDISQSLKDMALQVEQETELVKQDNLARGELIEAKEVSASLQKAASFGNEYWVVDTRKLGTDLSEIDSVEYWGAMGDYGTDYVTEAEKYPWMPASISDEDVPF
ncbi:hypothetical protein HLB44_25495 [Aquincola sp. S2]|uniref:Swt1-like HEPN domain-containing protein n=1 Tax=Pseudaquabacterium terrae TaxID=2732868 RepID=A0ABX2ENW4_9BURK|nr:Swt1 family HEPN domain-containing protein [Aquabacterium terrae]NRF70369.1 hypothetical protein [Aquabacterium terrae]